MKRTRQIALGFTLLINLCLGFTYSWSVFVGPLMEHFDRNLTALSITFTIGNASFSFMTIVGGRIQDRFGPVIAIRAGALISCGGLIMSGFADSLMLFYVCYGVLTTGGLGLTYCAVLMNINNFYPEKRGAVGGFVTACYGMSAVIFSPVASFLIEAAGVLNTYRIFGCFFLAILMLASFFIKPAPPSELLIRGDDASSASSDKTWKEMIRTPSFYVIFSLMVIGATAGLMIISQASLLAQNMMGASVTKAAFTVSIIACANASGRITWGILSDFLGRNTVLHFIYLIPVLAMAGLSVIQHGQYALFTICAMLVAFCYGGIMGTFPALVTDHFGAKHNGTNYGIIISGSGIGGLIGPVTAAWTQSLTPGNYDLAFYVSAALSVSGVLLTFLLRRTGKRNKTR